MDSIVDLTVKIPAMLKQLLEEKQLNLDHLVIQALSAIIDPPVIPGPPAEILSGHLSNVDALAIDNQRLFSGDNTGFIRVWDKQTHQCVVTLEHQYILKALAVDDQFLYSGCGWLRVWDKQDWHCNQKILLEEEIMLMHC